MLIHSMVFCVVIISIVVGCCLVVLVDLFISHNKKLSWKSLGEVTEILTHSHNKS